MSKTDVVMTVCDLMKAIEHLDPDMPVAFTLEDGKVYAPTEARTGDMCVMLHVCTVPLEGVH